MSDDEAAAFRTAMKARVVETPGPIAEWKKEVALRQGLRTPVLSR